MITSVQNPRVKSVRGLQAKKRAREQEQAFVIEGLHLAREAVAAEAAARLVLYTEDLDARGRGLVNSLAKLGAETEAVSPAVMAACSGTETPPGLIAVIQVPELRPPSPLDLALVLDGLSDPGNLGTMLRTALAAGVQLVLLTGGTVDPYNPKVVRAAAGAHFHLPVQTVVPGDLPASVEGLDLWLAEARTGTPHARVDWRSPCALIIGSEAHGPSEAVRALPARRVHIPTAWPTESLNAAAAAAVLLFEIARQRGLP
ncbi:MAG: RNA methyltransferase [Planctomycetes bacterium]|nr:RNA methyltransferase [Planctomycetota bacterium]